MTRTPSRVVPVGWTGQLPAGVEVIEAPTKVHQPHPTDWSTVAWLRRIGIEVGESFHTDALDPAVEEALSSVPGDAIAVLHSRLPGLASVVDGWQSNLDTMGV